MAGWAQNDIITTLRFLLGQLRGAQEAELACLRTQAQALDIESDRELDVAEALFDLANVAVAFSQQADSAETKTHQDLSHRHHDKFRRTQVKPSRVAGHS